MFKSIVQVLLLLSMVCSCSTYNVWQEAAEPKYAEVKSDNPDQDIEVSLKSSNKKYFCKIYLEHINDRAQKRKVCYLEVPSESMFQSYGGKLLNTPLAIIKDTGRVVLVVGVIAGYGAILAGPRETEPDESY